MPWFAYNNLNAYILEESIVITITNTSVYNFENAIRGARNPMNSWDRMDSYYDDERNYILGKRLSFSGEIM